MSDQNTTSRFTAQNKTTNERLSHTTVGLVGLADFRKRRAEVLEQQEREAREAAAAITRTNNSSNNNIPTPPDRSQTGTPAAVPSESETDRQPPAKKKKVKRAAKALVSFGDDDEENKEEEDGPQMIKPKSKKPTTSPAAESTSETSERKKIVNTSAPVIPKALTKAARLKEQAEKDALRKEFLILQAAVKQTEIAIPFVFYDGTNIPGGIVRVKKGDHIWLFLDKSRKVGAELGVGGDKNANARRDWARVGVDDLMLVRGGVIIPHHYEFYFFIMNKTIGPGGKRLFDYSAEAPLSSSTDGAAPAVTSSGGVVKTGAHIRTLEGAGDDPNWTKVVDRRWYQRNKHIYPASVWQEFDPDVDYSKEIQRDTGGNAFFFSGTK
ncbi:XAP5, circadian clock regulator-domain-containing protein [Triangularia setosa]|uniref:XAP5, circadian clock regulator-domain-containing protein n=1 Tax=Triangularia setosa TaxID=2587417 RepID=A0AAN6VZ81_9PEZI|nr:XAP5, circadian clock regulator-domain-containing protein [Podospora setosa]